MKIQQEVIAYTLACFQHLALIQEDMIPNAFLQLGGDCSMEICYKS